MRGLEMTSGRILWLLSSSLVLTACGGGGGSSAPAAVQVTNIAPTISDPGAYTLGSCRARDI